MATNKHASIRYQALDRCFSNPGRKYNINDLLAACNHAIQYDNPKSDGIKKRQLYADILFMESEVGWSIELNKVRDGKEVYYRYADPDFSINKKGLNDSEAEQMREALMILSRFRGMPQFEWVDAVVAKFESSFGLKKGAEKIIGFDENKDYTAVEHISALFNFILHEKPIKVTYKNFKNENKYDVVLHPYYLKEYNNRWFCFGFNNDSKLITNLALDRIINIKEEKLKYVRNTEIDFNEYFEEVIGVTVQGELQKVVLRIAKDLWPYIQTKPLHGTQKVKTIEKDFVTISIELKPNYELQSLLLSHGEKIEVLEPMTLKKDILNRVKKIK